MAQYSAEQRRRINLLVGNPAFQNLDPSVQKERLMTIGASEADATATVNDIQADRAAQGGTSLMTSTTPPSQRGLMERILPGMVAAGTRAAPSILGEEVAGQISRAVPSLRPFELPLRAGGAMAGEAARQAFLAPEGEEFDPLEILASGAIPARRMGQGLPAALGLPTRSALGQRRGRIRFARSMVPGAGAGLLEQAREEIANIPRHIREEASELVTQQFPGENLGTLRAKSLQMNPEIPLENFQQAAGRVARGEELAAEFGAQMGGRPARIARKGQERPTITLEQLEPVRKNIGGAIGQARNAGNTAVEDNLRGLLAGFFQDLDAAVARGVPGAVEYKASLEGFRRMQAADDLDRLLEKFSRPLKGEDFESLNLPLLLRDMRKAFNPQTAKTARPRGFNTLPDFLTASEKRELLDLVEFWSENLPALPTRMGINAANIGSGQLAFRGAGAAGAAMLLNRLAGGPVIDPTMAGVGGAVVSGAISNMMMSPRGRRMLRGFIERGGPININEMLSRFVLQSTRADLMSPEGVSRQLMQRALPPQIGMPR